MRVGAVAMATVMLGLVAGCGADAGSQRPPGVFPSFKADLYAYPQMNTVCVPGPEGNELTCTTVIDKTLSTLHTLRDVIKARPDADKYHATLAEIDKVDAASEKYQQSHCRGTLSPTCSVLANEIIGNDAYRILMSEDAPVPGGRG